MDGLRRLAAAGLMIGAGCTAGAGRDHPDSLLRDRALVNGGPGPVSVASPANATRVIGNEAALAVTYAPLSTLPAATVQITLDGSPLYQGAISGQPGSVDLSLADPGAHTLCFTATDAAGAADYLPTCDSFQRLIDIANLADLTGRFAVPVLPHYAAATLFADLEQAQTALSAGETAQAHAGLIAYANAILDDSTIPNDQARALRDDALWLAGRLTPPSAAPSAPTGLVATAGISQVTLSWSGDGTAAWYELERSVNGGAFTTLGTWSGTRYTDAPLAEAAYAFRIVAHAQGQASAPGSTAAASVSLPDITQTAWTAPQGLGDQFAFSLTAAIATVRGGDTYAFSDDGQKISVTKYFASAKSWSQPAVLAARGLFPAAGADAAGNVFVTWLTLANGPVYSYYAARLDALTGAWDTTLLESNTAGEYSFVTVEPGGAALAVWETPGGASTHSRLYLPGTGWLPVEVALAGQGNVAFQPFYATLVATGSGYSAVAAWRQSGTQFLGSVYTWSSTTQAGSWTSPQPIQTSAIATGTAAGAGQLWASWYIGVSGSETSGISTPNPDGSWTPMTLNDQGVQSSYSSVALNSSGQGAFVYSTDHESPVRIFARTYANGAWGAPVQLGAGASTSGSRYPAVRIDEHGTAIATWFDFLKAAPYYSAGSARFTPQQSWRPLDAVVLQNAPHQSALLSMGPDGTASMAWTSNGRFGQGPPVVVSVLAP